MLCGTYLVTSHLELNDPRLSIILGLLITICGFEITILGLREKLSQT